VMQGAEDFLLVDYGKELFSLNNRCRATALDKALSASTGEVSFATGIMKTIGCCNCKSHAFGGV
jgi:hypothetical protein